MRRKYVFLALLCIVAVLLPAVFLTLRANFPRPYFETADLCGVDPALVYAVMRKESGYKEEAVSRAGAVGLMQLKPSTAEFVCSRMGVGFSAEKLKDGEYNLSLGAWYLSYLFEKFSDERTVLAAYNAGEGTVRKWLSEEKYSSNGSTLTRIPYPETEEYVKKVEKFKKIYRILYR